MKQYWFYLIYSSERLKDDKDFVLEAVKQNGFTLYDASERLKDDKELQKLAGEKNAK